MLFDFSFVEREVTKTKYVFRFLIGPYFVTLFGEVSSYPTRLSWVGVVSFTASRKACDKLRYGFLAEFQSKVGEPFLLDAVQWFLDAYEREKQKALAEQAVPPKLSCQASGETDNYILLLRYDRMRGRRKYICKLTRWSHDWSLHGTLFFLRTPSLIFLLLQGNEDDCKVQ